MVREFLPIPSLTTQRLGPEDAGSHPRRGLTKARSERYDETDKNALTITSLPIVC